MAKKPNGKTAKHPTVKRFAEELIWTNAANKPKLDLLPAESSEWLRKMLLLWSENKMPHCNWSALKREMRRVEGFEITSVESVKNYARWRMPEAFKKISDRRRSF